MKECKMIIYPELERIVEINEERNSLIFKLSTITDIEGLDFDRAELVKLSDKQIKRFIDTNNFVDGEYLVEQHTGFCEDYYYGFMWFKAKEKNMFIKIPFEC